VLSIDLSSYTPIITLNSYPTTTVVNALLGNYVLSTTLVADYRTTAASNAYIQAVLSSYVTSASLSSQLGSYALLSSTNAALASKIDTLSGVGCTVTGSGTSRVLTVDTSSLSTTSYVQSNFLSPLTTPPSFTVGSGLNANLTANTIALTLNYTETRPSLYLTSGSGFKTLQASGSDLQWDGNTLAKASDLLSIDASGTSYPLATRLNFTNHSVLFDSATKMLNIGQYQYQTYLRLGTAAQNGDLTRGSAGALEWDGAPLAKSADLSNKQDALSLISGSRSPTYLVYTAEAQGLYLS